MPKESVKENDMSTLLNGPEPGDMLRDDSGRAWVFDGMQWAPATEVVKELNMRRGIEMGRDSTSSPGIIGRPATLKWMVIEANAEAKAGNTSILATGHVVSIKIGPDGSMVKIMFPPLDGEFLPVAYWALSSVVFCPAFDKEERLWKGVGGRITPLPSKAVVFSTPGSESVLWEGRPSPFMERAFKPKLPNKKQGLSFSPDWLMDELKKTDWEPVEGTVIPEDETGEPLVFDGKGWRHVESLPDIVRNYIRRRNVKRNGNDGPPMAALAGDIYRDMDVGKFYIYSDDEWIDTGARDADKLDEWMKANAKKHTG